MEREDQANTDCGLAPRPAMACESAPASPARGAVGRRACRAAAAALAAVAGVMGLLLFLRVPPPHGQAQDGPPLFPGWDKPDVALVLSGQQHGYLQPCGCSHPQYGGLTRRYNFMQSLKERGWPVVAVDLGSVPDLPKRTGPQTLLKYVTAMKAFKLMDYTAVGFGRTEMSLPLHEALNRYSLNNPSPPVVGTNLLTREKEDDPFHETVKAWAVGGSGDTPRVGVLALAAPSLQDDVRDKIKDPDVRFHRDTRKVLDKALGELRAKKTELVVVLYQGTPREAKACADFCNQRHKADKTFPQINVFLCLTEEDEPSGIPEQVGDTLVVGVGHKGRYVGVVGAFRTGKAAQPWQLRYQMVRVGPEYKTAPGKEKGHPVMDLMEEYAQEVKDGNYLAQYRQKKHPVQVTFKDAAYAGSLACRKCHADAYNIWEHSKHAHAYKTLEDATRPKNRQYDGECVVCHVVGFGHQTGFTDEVKTPKLKNVGCESCHGPCSEHIDDPRNMTVRWAINPYKARPNANAQANIRRMNQIDMFCQSCHDIDNDVHWQFRPKWQKIVHMLPRKDEAKQNGK